MSRTNARSRRLRRRPSRTVPASIVAVVLLASGVLGAVAAIARLATGAWAAQVTQPASAVASWTWGSTAAVGTSIGVLVVGLVLLVAGLKPGGFRSAQLRPPAAGAVGQTDYVIGNAGVARLAAGEADQVDGVDRVSASADGRRVRLHLVTSSEQATEIRSEVLRRVAERLAGAGLDPAPRVTATVRTKDL